MELQAIAACVPGECSLAGSRVSLIGTLVGTFVLMGIQSLLVVMGVQPQWFVMMLGTIVIAAASADRMFRSWVSCGV